MGAGKRIKQKHQEIKDKLSNGSLPCIPCAAEDHLLCYTPTDEDLCCCTNLKVEFENIENKRGGSIKGADEITDVQSTGRKRAARLYPITEGMICEWANLKKAGGGVVPIVGCLNNPATDIHHGPDKNTLNNTDTNVHRICAFCHNWWHARNDEYYGSRPAGTEPFIPLDGHEWCLHDSATKATLEEIVHAQIGRKQPKRKEN